jgi:hypothetical protein
MRASTDAVLSTTNIDSSAGCGLSEVQVTRLLESKYVNYMRFEGLL